MEGITRQTYYDKNKDKILSDVRTRKNEQRKQLLILRGFSEKLDKWAHLNPETITLCFTTINDLEELLKIDDLRKIEIADTEINTHKHEIYENNKSLRLRNRKDILTTKGYPPILAQWVRINKNSVSLSFDNNQEFEKFLSIKDDILNFIEANRTKSSPIVATISNSNL